MPVDKLLARLESLKARCPLSGGTKSLEMKDYVETGIGPEQEDILGASGISPQPAVNRPSVQFSQYGGALRRNSKEVAPPPNNGTPLETLMEGTARIPDENLLYMMMSSEDESQESDVYHSDRDGDETDLG